MPGTTTKPRGRPTKLGVPCRTNPDGTTSTTAEVLVERLRLGLDKAEACDTAGVSRNTLHQWHLRGSRARAQAAATRKPVAAADRPYLDFADAIERATAEAELDRLQIVDGVARGGRTITKTTTKWARIVDPGTGRVVLGDDGQPLEQVIERTEVTEQLRPEWTAAAWWLERKRGYVRPLSVELTGAGGAPLVPQAEAARDLADAARDYLQGVADGKAQAAKAGKVKAPAT